MLSSLLLALASSSLLAHALPTSPNTNPNELRPRGDGWVPVVPTPALTYPNGNNAATCPANPSNPWAPPSKRSLTTSYNLDRRQPSPLCEQVASCSLNNFEDLIANTGQIPLLEGATYVLSWAFNQAIAYIIAWRDNPDGTTTRLQGQSRDNGVGQMTIQPGLAMNAHFEFLAGDWDPISGEVALYLTANGDKNPDPKPPPPGPGGGRHD